MPKNFKREASPNPSKRGEQENNLSADNQGIEPFFFSGASLILFVQYFCERFAFSGVFHFEASFF